MELYGTKELVLSYLSYMDQMDQLSTVFVVN